MVASYEVGGMIDAYYCYANVYIASKNDLRMMLRQSEFLSWVGVDKQSTSRVWELVTLPCGLLGLLIEMLMKSSDEGVTVGWDPTRTHGWM